MIHSGIRPNIAGWKMDPDWVDVYPIKNGDIPASYVSLPTSQDWDPRLFRISSIMITLPKTNSLPLKMGLPKRKLVFQPSIFRGYVSFREGISFHGSFHCFWPMKLKVWKHRRRTDKTEKPLRKGSNSDASLPSPRSMNAGEGDNMGHYMTPTQTMQNRGNPSKSPCICIVWSPHELGKLMTPERTWGLKHFLGWSDHSSNRPAKREKNIKVKTARLSFFLGEKLRNLQEGCTLPKGYVHSLGDQYVLRLRRRKRTSINQQDPKWIYHINIYDSKLFGVCFAYLSLTRPRTGLYFLELISLSNVSLCDILEPREIDTERFSATIFQWLQIVCVVFPEPLKLVYKPLLLGWWPSRVIWK